MTRRLSGLLGLSLLAVLLVISGVAFAPARGPFRYVLTG
jgi:hypothetical protein